jgi:hypothetical protein
VHLVIISFVVWMGAILRSQAPVPAYVPPPPEQPLPYSHRQHLALGLACAQCHPMPDPGHAATLPSTSTCMTCHARVKTDSPAIQHLARAHAAGEMIPWKRVYLLPDFVFFSHRRHTMGATPIACELCHGPVRELDVMQRVGDISMAACTSCHQEKQAPTRCDSCHDTR